jgi:hypothetical protein
MPYIQIISNNLRIMVKKIATLRIFKVGGGRLCRDNFRKNKVRLEVPYLIFMRLNIVQSVWFI